MGQARFLGEAEAIRSPDGRVTWLERGLLTLNTGERLQAQRALIFDIHGPARTLSLFHGDGPTHGGLIHRFAFDGTHVANDIHDCPPDRYSARLRLLAPDHFQLTYEVEGPRKGYRMSTVYRKITSGGAERDP